MARTYSNRKPSPAMIKAATSALNSPERTVDSQYTTNTRAALVGRGIITPGSGKLTRRGIEILAALGTTEDPDRAEAFQASVHHRLRNLGHTNMQVTVVSRTETHPGDPLGRAENFLEVPGVLRVAWFCSLCHVKQVSTADDAVAHTSVTHPQSRAEFQADGARPDDLRLADVGTLVEALTDAGHAPARVTRPLFCQGRDASPEGITDGFLVGVVVYHGPGSAPTLSITAIAGGRAAPDSAQLQAFAQTATEEGFQILGSDERAVLLTA